MIWAGKYKYKLVFLALIILALGWLYFSKGDVLHKSGSVLNSESTRHTSSYIYQNIYDNLQLEKTVLTPLENHEILSQIFPKSRIWKFTSKEGDTSYLADGEDKAERNAVSDQVLTDKIVGFNTLQTDFDGDKEEELIVFTIINFKDVALCCNEKRFLDIFKKNKEGKWRLVKEKEFEVYYGGKHRGKMKVVTLRDPPIIEIIIDGYYYNGLKTSTVEWYLWQREDFKQIWREHLFYDTDAVGTFPEEAMKNYQADFELEEKENEDYPRIKLIKNHTKRNGRNLSTPEEEVIYYVWDREKLTFEERKITATNL